MDNMLGKHATNWSGPTKARKDINLYFGWMYYIQGFGASVWLAQAVWLQYTASAYTPHCASLALTPEMAVDFCLGSWKFFIHAANDELGIPDRVKTKQFAFIKIGAPVCLLMCVLFMMAKRYWLIGEEGRVSNYVTEYKDKMLPAMEEETAEKKNIQNIREDRINYITRSILEFKGDTWYFRRYLVANVFTGIIIFFQIWFLHFVLGNISMLHWTCFLLSI